MEIADIKEVVCIEQESFSSPWSEKSFLDAITEDDNVYMVAVDEGEIAGYCGMWGIQGEGNIYNVCVKKEKRGQGVGERLFQTFLNEGEKSGLTAFTLEVRVSNERAIRLYEKCGFENAGIRKNFYDNPKEDAIIMWKYIQ